MRKYLDFVTIETQLSKTAEVNFVCREPKYFHILILKDFWETPNLSSPEDWPRSKLGGRVPAILYLPTASTLGSDKSTLQVLRRNFISSKNF